MLKISNIWLAEGKRVDIIIEGSKIQNVCEPNEIKEGIDGTGLIAIPGIIDPHVHFRIPGGSYKEDWGHGSLAALKGGVTTVGDMPNTSPPLTTFVRLLEKRKLVVNNRGINTYFWFGATPNNLAEIAAVSQEPDILGVKVFMGSTTGDLLVTEEIDLYRIFSVCAANNLIVGVHAEDEMTIRAKRLFLGREPWVADHYLIRATEVETLAVQRALRLVWETGCRLYFCHLSTPESVELVLKAKEKGLPVFIEVSPHHITLDARRLQRSSGAYFKTNPPLRISQQAILLSEYVCKGYIDTIGSDHAPHTHNEKLNTNYDNIPSGVPGVETLLPVLLNLTSQGRLTMERLVSLTSSNAARIFKLTSKGKIEKGCDADLVLIDPNQEMTIHSSDMATKCGWTPYEGMKVKGVPKITILGGNIVMSR